MSGHLCLKWNNHSSAFEKLLNNLHLKEMYSDATLVCQGKFYPVHRFVLTTCSDYFEEIFIRCVRLNNKHPFIIVKDINSVQMEALLNYMYRGEVNVPQELLPELIKAAEAFKIKGLAVPDEEPLNRSSKRRVNTSSSTSQSKKSRCYEDKNKLCDNDVSDIDSELVDREHHDTHSGNTKTLPNAAKDSTQNNEVENFIVADSMSDPHIKSEPIDQLDEVDEIINKNSESSIKEEQTFDYFTQSYSSYNANEDVPGIEDHFDVGQASTWENSQDFEPNNSMEGDSAHRIADDYNYEVPDCLPRNSAWVAGNQKPIKCPLCSYESAYSCNVRRHYRKHTKEKPYQCSHCSYTSSYTGNLKRHVQLHHEVLK